MQPSTSVLFKNIKRLAPMRRWEIWHLSRVRELNAQSRSYLFQKQPGQFLSTVTDSKSIRRIDHPNQSVSLLKVIFPVGSKGFLPSYVPWWWLVAAGWSWRYSVTYIYSTDTYNGSVRISTSKKRKRAYPSKSIVFIINPSVGLTVLTSSFIIFFTMVVLPALSSPLRGNHISTPYVRIDVCTYSIKILISLSFNRAFLNIESILLAVW